MKATARHILLKKNNKHINNASNITKLKLKKQNKVYKAGILY